MGTKNIQPTWTWTQFGISFVIACLISSILFMGLNTLTEVLIKATLHSWLATPTSVVLVLAICSLVPLTVWMTFVISKKMAEQNKEASDC